MYQHLMIIGFDYSEEERIGVHFSYLQKMSEEQLRKLKIIKEMVTQHNLDVTIHSVVLTGPSLEAVCDRDHYFEGIHFYEKYEDFIKQLLKSQEIT